MSKRNHKRRKPVHGSSDNSAASDHNTSKVAVHSSLPIIGASEAPTRGNQLLSREASLRQGEGGDRLPSKILSRRKFLLGAGGAAISLVSGGIFIYDRWGWQEKIVKVEDEFDVDIDIYNNSGLDWLDRLVRYFKYNDFDMFRDISDLERWQASKKCICIEAGGKADIYNGLIFPIIQSQDIKEIRFLSTSILWGHRSFGGTRISKDAINHIYSLCDDKEIKIFSSTPDLTGLYEEYGSSLEVVISEFNDLSKKNERFHTMYNNNFHRNDYRMLLRTITDDAYEIRFDNNKVSGNSVRFSGGIQVRKLEPNNYKLEIALFDKNFGKGISYNNAISWETTHKSKRRTQA